jgi:hypothetical protein
MMVQGSWHGWSGQQVKSPRSGYCNVMAWIAGSSPAMTERVVFARKKSVDGRHKAGHDDGERAGSPSMTGAKKIK